MAMLVIIRGFLIIPNISTSYASNPSFARKIIMFLLISGSPVASFAIQDLQASQTALQEDFVFVLCALKGLKAENIFQPRGFVWKCWVNIPNEIAI